MPEDVRVELDSSVLSEDALKLEKFLLSRIIGQERAISQFVKVFQQLIVGLNKDNRPAGVFLFAGPTGCGKTELVRCVAEYLLGSKNAMTRIDCGEFQEKHEVAKLIGAPPGYVGYSEPQSVRLAQNRLDQFQTSERKINILLIDEIEEAHDALLSSILQVLDAGRLTLGNGQETDFTKTIVVMTSNIGETEMQKKLAGRELGLRPEKTESETTDDHLYDAAKGAAGKYFKAKFMNRIDRVIVFRSLSDESLKTILHNELNFLQERVWGSAVKAWTSGDKSTSPPMYRPELRYTENAIAFLLKEGKSNIYGARELNRSVDRFVVFPLCALIGSKQIEADDIIEVGHKEGEKKLTFSRIGKRDIKPLPSPEPKQAKTEFDKVQNPTSTPPKLPPRKPYSPFGYEGYAFKWEIGVSKPVTPKPNGIK